MTDVVVANNELACTLVDRPQDTVIWTPQSQIRPVSTSGVASTWYFHTNTTSATSTTECLIVPYRGTGAICTTGASTIQIHRIDGGLNSTLYVTGTSSVTANVVYSGSGSYVTVTSGYVTGVNSANYWGGNSQLLKPHRGPLIKKSIKSSIKRALKLMANFGMEEDARIFLSGNEIEVSHPDSKFKFVLSLSKYRGLLASTERPGYSTPYDLSLYTKTDVHIADLCVYMDKTPVLDQVLALSMFVKTGNEEDILEKANFQRLSSDIELRKTLALGCPMLESKLRTNSVRVR